MPLANQVQAQRFNEGGLAHARHAADAQAERLARGGSSAVSSSSACAR